MLTLYGIKNCDTVKKARLWLEGHGIEYQYHDFRQDGLEQNLLKKWIEIAGKDTLINKRSTTWRTLSDNEKLMTTADQTLKLLIKNPTLIKRPVIHKNKVLIIGFNEAEYKNL